MAPPTKGIFVFTKVLARRKVILQAELLPDEGEKELGVKLALEERGLAFLRKPASVAALSATKLAEDVRDRSQKS
ncbi:MAG: hypothetical protein ACP5LJ_01855 [Candidatus Bipolaricaulaceae bacterium]